MISNFPIFLILVLLVILLIKVSKIQFTTSTILRSLAKIHERMDQLAASRSVLPRTPQGEPVPEAPKHPHSQYWGQERESTTGVLQSTDEGTTPHAIAAQAGTIAATDSSREGIKITQPMTTTQQAPQKDTEQSTLPLPNNPSAATAPKSSLAQEQTTKDEATQALGRAANVTAENTTMGDTAPRANPQARTQSRAEQERVIATTTPQQQTLRPKQAQKSEIEKLLTENLLSKIGIVTLILGIGFFVKYAIDQEWINEVGRVGIGLLVGGVLIAIAHKLQKIYNLFSSILAGGGIAIFYITVTLAFREYELFPQTIAFALLVLITFVSVLLSLYYDRKELAIFSLLGGFASPLLASTGAGNYVVLFSYLLILNSGMLIIAYRKNWRTVGLLCYPLSWIYLWSWLLINFSNQYLGAGLFVIAFYLQFYLLALFECKKNNSTLIPYATFLLLGNNLLAYMACCWIFKAYPQDILGLITIGFALINAGILMAILRKGKMNQNVLYLIIGIVLSFVSLAIPVQLKGNVITLFWSAELVVLLWLWKKTNINVMRLFFMVVAILTLISYGMDLIQYRSLPKMPVLINQMCMTAGVVIAGFGLSRWLLREADGEEMICLKRNSLCSMASLKRMLTLTIIGLTYLAPLMEIVYQLNFETNYYMIMMVVATYTVLYVAVLSFIFRNHPTHRTLIYTLTMLFILGFSVIFPAIVQKAREMVYNYELGKPALFAWHLLAWPAIVWIFYFLASNVRKVKTWNFKWICRGLVLSAVVLLSVELNNCVIMAIGNSENYYAVLRQVHTIGYPILWAALAMFLVLLGIRNKEVELRKIGLFFFGAIILKFYLYDVWRMNQGGRIISFVFLGVILLLVSFMQQKIKVLVQSKEEENAIEPSKSIGGDE